ncbi:hypothetical protein B296_00009414 [Ensete ventricosum]|uniref:Uncharacterized protein n=1 Tax=Ensete ventricosum TaxID=4639 RepID=A0A427AVT4_ENSVE|nr:hypothetical protein B296_00009414 [Ensete ventricosum]
MSASDESYNVICARKAATCSVGSELPSYDSKAGNLKLIGISLSCISGVKGDPCLELSPASSFDLVTSFCTSSNYLFMRRSCTQSESVESDNNVSAPMGCAPPRGTEWLISLGRSKGSQTNFLAGPAMSGQVGLALCVPKSPLGRPEAVGTPTEGHCWLVDPSHWLCQHASRLLLGALHAGRPVALALSCRQSPAIRGTAGWSARRIGSAMPSIACCQGRYRLAP